LLAFFGEDQWPLIAIERGCVPQHRTHSAPAGSDKHQTRRADSNGSRAPPRTPLRRRQVYARL
jgi:hypothetical protein